MNKRASIPQDDAELRRTVDRLLRPPLERALDPSSREGRSWRFFDVPANWLILVLALVNLSLVLIDYTYLDLRHFYQAQGWRELVDSYDRVKGIEPHRVTLGYQTAAEKTFQILSERPASPAARQAIRDMQQKSVAILKEDPFVTAGLRGVSERLKSKFREHAWAQGASVADLKIWYDPLSIQRLEATFKLRSRPWDKISVTTAVIGSRAANRLPERSSPTTRPLDGFWTADNLTPERLETEKRWFQSQITPLLARNYWQTYGEDGGPADHFWVIDCMFIPIFAAEFILRGWVGVRRGVYPNFRLFVLARWYDVIYFLPLLLYTLPPSLQGPLHAVRIISVGARMERLGLINPVAVISPYVTKPLDIVADLVNVKLLSNYQQGIREFELEKALNTLNPKQRAELVELIEANLLMIVEKVLPDVRPALESLANSAAQQALESTPAYTQLKTLPVFGQLPEELLRRAIGDSMAQAHTTMLRAINDPRNVALTRAFISQLTESLLKHTAHVGTEEQVKRVLLEVLEEQKRKLLAG
ncbi:MAG: hypothetical protein VKN33_00345 [Candidatus Sericytochromatia bacterium]|nr:hypothetical protein [Candidatus Sericytochromatia bacterium]